MAHNRSVIASAQSSGKIRMSDHKVGQHVTVKLSGGRLVDAEIKEIIETAEGIPLQVSLEKRPQRFIFGKSSEGVSEVITLNLRTFAPSCTGSQRR
jgi:hypothetical protein